MTNNSAPSVDIRSSSKEERTALRDAYGLFSQFVRLSESFAAASFSHRRLLTFITIEYPCAMAKNKSSSIAVSDQNLVRFIRLDGELRSASTKQMMRTSSTTSRGPTTHGLKGWTASRKSSSVRRRKFGRGRTRKMQLCHETWEVNQEREKTATKGSTRCYK